VTEAKLHIETTDLERQVIEAGDVGLEILSDSVQSGADGQMPSGLQCSGCYLSSADVAIAL
jgi:hypothetical protein